MITSDVPSEHMCVMHFRHIVEVLTAMVALLIAPIQTVIISITLPQGTYAALIMALELIAFAPLRL